MINLEKKTIIITGAAGNVGRSITNTLAKLGANLIIIDKERRDLDKVCSNLNLNSSQKILSLACNFEIEKQRSNVIEKIKKKYNSLDCLINNAAFTGVMNISGWNEPFNKQSLDTWRRAFEVNLTSVFHFCRDLNSLLSKSNSGSIINIASIYGEYGPDYSLYKNTKMANPAAYASSKGGLIQFSRWLSTTLAPKIRVNVISPGGIERGQSKKFLKKYITKTPLNKMATENDISNSVLYLVSDMSSHVTGQVLRVDGGWGVW